MVSTTTPRRRGNRLLNRLPKAEYRSLIRSEEPVSLAQGDEVYRQDGPGSPSHVYFPTSGVISLTVLLEDGTEIEAATIGNARARAGPLANFAARARAVE